MTHLYGPPKQLNDISLGDMQKHPIWLWCINLNLPDEDDGPLGGDETSMRPWLGDANVAPEMIQPFILLKVEGTELWAKAIFDREIGNLDALGVFGSDGWRTPDWYLENQGEQITYVAVPAIEGQPGLRFTARNRRRNEAFLEGCAPPTEAATNTAPPIDGTVAALLQSDPELLELVATYIRGVGKDLLGKGYSIIVPWVSGGLEDEDPALHAQLVEKSKEAGFAVNPLSSEIFQNEETASRSALVAVVSMKKQSDGGYLVKGYWGDRSEEIQIVSRKLVFEQGQWRVS